MKTPLNTGFLNLFAFFFTFFLLMCCYIKFNLYICKVNKAQNKKNRI